MERGLVGVGRHHTTTSSWNRGGIHELGGRERYGGGGTVVGNLPRLIVHHLHLLHLILILHQLSPADLLPLGVRDVERLVVYHVPIHIHHRVGGGLRGGEANEPEAPRVPLLVVHDLGRGDLPELLEEALQALIGDLVAEVLDVDVHALGLLMDLLDLVVADLLQLGFPLLLLLGAVYVQGRAAVAEDLVGFVVKLIDGLGSVLGLVKIDEAKALLVISLLGHYGAGDLPKLAKLFIELIIGHTVFQVFNINVGEDSVLVGAFEFLLELPNENYLILDLHVVDLIYSVLSIVFVNKVDETISS